ncbi:NEL-type E3 ubiquitin ligase domain-containing protein [Paraburkholderia rhynchosiae]|nr:NEL-type E3 ubiquitin ligase domain-containing protein [Paraburkholderia rhynchosiae]
MSRWASRIDRTLPRSAKAAFHRDVAALGHEMSTDGSLRKTCIDHMREGLSECSDRALLMWQQVQTARQAHHASRGAYDASQLFALGRGMYRLGEVDKYALKAASGRGYGHDEGVEVVLRAREALREALQLPIPHTDGASTHDAGEVIEGLSDYKLEETRVRIVSGELHEGGKALAGFLASWTPLVTHLTATTPELADLHQSINLYRDGLIDNIDAHAQDPASPAAAGKAPLTSAQYEARLTRGGAEVVALRDAANLSAVRGAYLPVAPGPVETQWLKVTAIRSQKAALPFVEGLRDAITRGTLKAGWVHPTGRWNHLHVAAVAGNADLTRALIEYGVPPAQPDTSGLSPLHLAAASASAGSVAALIAAQADANTADNTGYRPLHWAARSGDRRTLEALLPSVTEIDAVHPDTGTTALHLAATLGKLDAVRALLARGANPLLKTADGSTVRDTLKESRAARRTPEYKLTYEALKAAERVALAVGSSRAQ